MERTPPGADIVVAPLRHRWEPQAPARLVGPNAVRIVALLILVIVAMMSAVLVIAMRTDNVAQTIEHCAMESVCHRVDVAVITIVITGGERSAAMVNAFAVDEIHEIDVDHRILLNRAVEDDRVRIELLR